MLLGGSAHRLLQREGRAIQSGQRVGDEHARHGGQIAGETSLGLEAGPELRLEEARAQARHDAAADVDPAPRAQRQRDAAGEAAQEGAELVHGLAAERVTAERPLDDLLGAEPRLARLPRHRRHRRMQRGQTDAGEEALGRHMRKLAARDGEQLSLVVVDRRERHVTALARQRDPAAGGLDHPAHAQTGARANDGQRAARRAAGRPRHGGDLVGPQARQRQRQRLEVVEQAQLVQTQIGLQLAAREGPGAVGQLDPIAVDGGGQRERGPARTRRQPQAGEFFQIGLRRGAERLVLRHRQLAHVLHRLPRAVDPREAGVAAADVRHQPRIALVLRASGCLVPARGHTLFCLHCSCPDV
ncbi:hypothetical protein Ddc_18822 [Ditylenchus destructor]|nr:hypothetical protein Ddc_18822 [Ditylenchus destructor]